MKDSGIYKIESKVYPEKIYIGSAVDLRSRRYGHIGTLKRGVHKNSKLQAHYNKYGEDDLVFSVVAMCDKSELVPIDGIIRPEQFFIWAYNPWFNLNPIAGSNMGRKFDSPETKKKQSDAKKGKPQSEETKAKRRGKIPWNKGKKTGLVPRTAFKKGSTPWNTGKHRSDETKSKISKRNKGTAPWNKGLKTGHIPWNKGKHNVYSAETLVLMGNGRRGKEPWNKGITKNKKAA